MTRPSENERVKVIAEVLKVNGSLNWAPIIIKADPLTTYADKLEAENRAYDLTMDNQAREIERLREALEGVMPMAIYGVQYGEGQNPDKDPDIVFAKKALGEEG